MAGIVLGGLQFQHPWAGSDFYPTCTGIPELVFKPDQNDRFWLPLKMLPSSMAYLHLEGRSTGCKKLSTECGFRPHRLVF